MLLPVASPVCMMGSQVVESSDEMTVRLSAANKASGGSSGTFKTCKCPLQDTSPASDSHKQCGPPKYMCAVVCRMRKIKG